jgi:serine/threonine protein kinase
VTTEPIAWHREAYFGDLLKDEAAVVKTYESFPWMPRGASQPLFCLISELMDGGDIQHYLENQSRAWNESKACYEVIGILRVVRVLHEGGVVHRDLTPKNVFVTAGRRLKIGDFGITLHNVAHRGVTADAFNPRYAPPAVLSGAAKHWSLTDDVFHVGNLLAMLLAGRASSPTTRKEIKSLPCSAVTKAIIQRCIGEKGKRFRNAGELLAALEKGSQHCNRFGQLHRTTGSIAVKRSKPAALNCFEDCA